MYEVPRFLSGDFFIEKFMCQYDQSNIIMAKKIPATMLVAGNQVILETFVARTRFELVSPP